MTRARGLLVLLAALAALASADRARAETGYDLWLRYVPLPEPARRAYAHAVRAIVVQGGAATDGVIAAELRRGLSGLLAAEVPRWAGPRWRAWATKGTSSARRASTGTR